MFFILFFHRGLSTIDFKFKHKTLTSSRHYLVWATIFFLLIRGAEMGGLPNQSVVILRASTFMQNTPQRLSPLSNNRLKPAKIIRVLNWSKLIKILLAIFFSWVLRLMRLINGVL